MRYYGWVQVAVVFDSVQSQKVELLQYMASHGIQVNTVEYIDPSNSTEALDALCVRLKAKARSE